MAPSPQYAWDSSSRATTPALSPSVSSPSSTSSTPSPAFSPNPRPTIQLSSKGFILPIASWAPRGPPTSKSHARKQPAGHVPRPRNAFILFRLDVVKQGIFQSAIVTMTLKDIHETAVAITEAEEEAAKANPPKRKGPYAGKAAAEGKGKGKGKSKALAMPTYHTKDEQIKVHHEQMSRFASQLWKTMTAEEKEPWVQASKREKEHHTREHPGFRHLTSASKRDPALKADIVGDGNESMVVDTDEQDHSIPWYDEAWGDDPDKRPTYFTLYTHRSLMEKIFDPQGDEEGRTRVPVLTLYEFITQGGMEKFLAGKPMFPYSSSFELAPGIGNCNGDDDDSDYEDDEVEPPGFGAWNYSWNPPSITVPVSRVANAVACEQLSDGLQGCYGLPPYNEDIFLFTDSEGERAGSQCVPDGRYIPSPNAW